MNRTTLFPVFWCFLICMGSCYPWEGFAWIPTPFTRNSFVRSTTNIRAPTVRLWMAARSRRPYYEYDDDDEDEMNESNFEEPTKRQPEKVWQRIPFANNNNNNNNQYAMEYRSPYDRGVYDEDDKTELKEKRRLIGDDDGDNDDEDVVDDIDGSNSVGNFWVNPRKGLDPFPQPSQQGRRRNSSSLTRSVRGDIPPSTAEPHVRRRPPPSPRSRNGEREDNARIAKQRTTFRSGTPEPPAVFKDFYTRLFWYGFDPDETASAGGDSRTMFGGTKGKFNGLALLNDEQRPTNLLPPPRRSGASNSQNYRQERRREREVEGRSRNDDYWLEDDEDADDDYDNDTDNDRFDVEDKVARVNRDDDDSDDGYNPPSRAPFYDRDPSLEPSEESNDLPLRSRRRREQPRRRDSKPPKQRSDRDDWVSKEVSSWFSGDDVSQRSKKRQSDSQPWDMLKSFGSIFGLNNRQLEYQAQAYNERMGLEPNKDSGIKRRKRSRDNQRSGYAYRYVDDNDDEPPIIADYDVADDRTESEDVRTQAETGNSEDSTTVPAGRKKQRTWKDRAIAMERVPPPNIAAWGPTGDLGIDARTKAWIDAQEDIRIAKSKLEERERRASQAREDVIVLKADAELQRKRLSQGRGDPRFFQARLRQIELEIDDAARTLRRAQSQVEAARDELAEFEDRHWAILSLFNADLAQEQIVDAFRELEEQEPAIRFSRSRQSKPGDNPPPSTQT